MAFALDAVVVIGFASLGRASHDMDVWSGLWGTAWPFLVALIVGWVVALAWRHPFAPVRAGLPVWAVTVAGAMLLRWANGQGVQLVFVMVTAAVLLALIVGWRVVATLLRNRATHSH